MIFTFAGSIAHYIDDNWKLVETLVDFYHIDGDEHKGREAALAFVRTAAQRGGLIKMSIPASDNLLDIYAYLVHNVLTS